MTRLPGLTQLAVGIFSIAPAASAQQNIPVRQVGPADAVSRDTIGPPNGMRELSDGRLLVNDMINKRLVVLDRSLAKLTPLANATGDAPTPYGGMPTGIMAYRGDSTLLADRIASTFLLLTPAGAVTRVVSPPRAADMNFMLGTAAMSFQGFPGYAGLDAQGRVVFRSSAMPKFAAPRPGIPYVPPVVADSAPLLREDFDLRTADTLAWLKVRASKYSITPLSNGGVKISGVVNPMILEDDWVLMPDGTIAIVRARDYHIDWISPSDVRTSTRKMPIAWRRLDDDAKAAIIDSTKQALERQLAAAIAAEKNGNPAPAAALRHGMTVMPVNSEEGGQPAATPSDNGPLRAPEVANASDLPDYVPPIRPGMMRADRDGNLWILPMTSTAAGTGLVYDVVNRQGEVFQRVRLPAGRVLQAFGASGAIYMTVRDATGMRVERAHLVP